MKKILPALLFLLFALPSSAQSKITLQDLQGKWKLINYTTMNASLDLKTGKATVTESGKSLGPEYGKRIIEEMESYKDMLQTATLEIDGNNFTQLVDDVIKVGLFTIEDKEKYQVLNASFDDGSNVIIMVGIKDGKLFLGYPRNNKSYIYEKVK